MRLVADENSDLKPPAVPVRPPVIKRLLARLVQAEHEFNPRVGVKDVVFRRAHEIAKAVKAGHDN